MRLLLSDHVQIHLCLCTVFHDMILCKYVAHFSLSRPKYSLRIFFFSQTSFFLLTFLPSIYFILLHCSAHFISDMFAYFFIVIAVVDVTVAYVAVIVVAVMFSLR